MGILTPKDLSSNPAPPQVYNLKIYLLALSAAMGSSMFGYDSSFIGGTLSLPSFRSKFGLAKASANQRAALSSNIVSTFQGGCFFGTILCYMIAEKLGMRLTLMLCGVLFDIGTACQVAATGGLGLIYAGRVLTGKSAHFIAGSILTMSRCCCWCLILDCTSLYLRMFTTSHSRSSDWCF